MFTSTDTLGTVLDIVNTAGTIISKLGSNNENNKTTPDVVMTKADPQPPITLNLTINVYKDGQKESVTRSSQIDHLPQLFNGLCLDLNQSK